MENAAKSIIYGNAHQNRYGRFLPVCSSIYDRSAIASILSYLHDTPHFAKYNRLTYAYRVDEIPVVFVTQNRQPEAQHYEGSHSDLTIEGSGQKLLHLLAKFNIKNVFIGVLIEQFNPLLPFQTTNYRAIVQNSRLLLDELYKKVAALQSIPGSFDPNYGPPNVIPQLKTCDLTEQSTLVPPPNFNRTSQRPNHIYSKGKPQFLKEPAQNVKEPTYEIKFMWGRCKHMKEQFAELVKSLQERELEQLQYYSIYDKNAEINQVMRLFSIHEGLEKQSLLASYDFHVITKMNCEPLEERTLKKLDEIMKSVRKISADSLMKLSRPVGILYCLIQIRIRFSKTLKRIASLMEKFLPEEDNLKQGNQDPQKIGKAEHVLQYTRQQG